MNLRDFLFQIILLLAGAIIGIVANILGNPQRRIMLGIFGFLLIVIGAFWAGYEVGKSEATNILITSPTSTPTEQATSSPPATQAVASSTESTVAPISNPSAATQPSKAPRPSILFQDNFDNGLSEGWKVESGNPVIVNGMLTTDQDTWLTVRDASWKNYSVELDVITSTSCSLNSGGNVIGVRVNDLGNMIVYEWTACETQLVVVEEGKYNIVPSTWSGFHESDKNKLKIVVQDNNITVFVGDRQRLTYVNTKFSRGNIAFKLKPEAQFDNFVIKSLD